jgi:uncharacterized protein YjiS (DUF1127 family)
MTTTIRRRNPAAILLGAALAALRMLRRFARRARRNRMEPLAGLSDHMLRDIGVARTAVPAFRDRRQKGAQSPLGRFEWRARRDDAES